MAAEPVVGPETARLLSTQGAGPVPVRSRLGREPLTAPAKEDRLRCQCGNEHFFVTKVDFTCTVCFKSYRD